MIEIYIYTCVFDTCTSSWIKLYRMIWNQTTLDNCRVCWTRFFQTLWRSITQLLELNEQACREFSRDTGSLRLNSKGSANRIYGPCGLPLTEHNTVTTAAMDHLSTGEFYRYWPGIGQRLITDQLTATNR